MVNPNDVLNFDEFICQGDSIFLNGAWQNSAGIYSTVFSNVNGCDSTLNINLMIWPLPAPVISQAGDTLFAGATGTTYQWLLNGNPISGANGLVGTDRDGIVQRNLDRQQRL
ncbi:MAG: hypothetical protein IPP17_25915 [Bacteroidetes bacterium]|nr:hypothetical protein [Bacteroidota bacterium]